MAVLTSAIIRSTLGGLITVEIGFAAVSSQYMQSKLQHFCEGDRSIPSDVPKRRELTGPKTIFNCYLALFSCTSLMKYFAFSTGTSGNIPCPRLNI